MYVYSNDKAKTMLICWIVNIEDWRARFKQCECEAALEPIERIATGLSKLGEEDLIAMIKDVDEETANALKALLDANREEKEEAASGAKDSRV